MSELLFQCSGSVQLGQENEERGASRAIVSAATNTYCSHIQ